MELRASPGDAKKPPSSHREETLWRIGTKLEEITRYEREGAKNIPYRLTRATALRHRPKKQVTKRKQAESDRLRGLQ